MKLQAFYCCKSEIALCSVYCVVSLAHWNCYTSNTHSTGIDRIVLITSNEYILHLLNVYCSVWKVSTYYKFKYNLIICIKLTHVYYSHWVKIMWAKSNLNKNHFNTLNWIKNKFIKMYFINSNTTFLIFFW